MAEKCKSCFKEASSTSRAGLCKECVTALAEFGAEVAAPLPEPHPLRKIFEDGGATVHEDVYAPPSAFVSPLPEPTHIYKCSGGHLFTSKEDDIEAGCNHTFENDSSRCGLMGWHEYEVCKCQPNKVSPLPEIASEPTMSEDMAFGIRWVRGKVEVALDYLKDGLTDLCQKQLEEAMENDPYPETPSNVRCANPTCEHYEDEHGDGFGGCNVVFDDPHGPTHCLCSEFIDPRQPTPTPVPLGEPVQTFEEWWTKRGLKSLCESTALEAWNAAIAAKAVSITLELDWAKGIVEHMFKHFYPEIKTPNVLPDVLGLLTQISNMVIGLQRKAVPIGGGELLIGCTPNATPEEIALRRKNRSSVPIEWLEKVESALLQLIQRERELREVCTNRLKWMEAAEIELAHLRSQEGQP